MVMLISNHSHMGVFLNGGFPPNNTPQKMIISSRKNPCLLGKPTILGNPHIYIPRGPLQWNLKMPKRKRKTKNLWTKPSFFLRTSVLCFFIPFKGFFCPNPPKSLCFGEEFEGSILLAPGGSLFQPRAIPFGPQVQMSTPRQTGVVQGDSSCGLRKFNVEKYGKDLVIFRILGFFN